MQNDLNDYRELALGFVQSLCVDGGFRYRVSEAAAEPTVIASATVASLRAFLNRLGELPVERRQAWARYLLDSIAEDGLVDDPVDFAEPTQKQPLWALRFHRTRHVVWAVEALGGKQERPIQAVEPYRSAEAIRRWLDELWALNWPGGVWAAGNWIMDMGVLLDAQSRHLGNEQARLALVAMLDALNDRLEPETGFWRAKGDDDRVAMAGSMHLYPLYWAYGHELPYFDKAVKATLALQQPDGLFDFESGFGGSQCLDYDAALVLINGYVLLPEFREHIKAAFCRMAEAIKINLRPTGGWADCQKADTRHWSTRACVYRADQGSVWDTYARLMVVAMCELALEGRLPAWCRAEHHLFEIFGAGRGWRQGCSPALA